MRHTRTITYTAVDGCNNTNTCTQVITWKVDTTPPTFTLYRQTGTCLQPGDDSWLRPQSNQCRRVGWCGSPPSLAPVRTQSRGRCFHDRTITYTATDGCNSATCVQHIFLTTDTTAPTFILCPSNMNLGLSPPAFGLQSTQPMLAEWLQQSDYYLHAAARRDQWLLARACWFTRRRTPATTQPSRRSSPGRYLITRRC